MTFLISKNEQITQQKSSQRCRLMPCKTETLINTGADLMSTKALLNASVSRGAFKVEELRGRLCVFQYESESLTRGLGVFVNVRLKH